jgi:hypothetical protein
MALDRASKGGCGAGVGVGLEVEVDNVLHIYQEVEGCDGMEMWM